MKELIKSAVKGNYGFWICLCISIFLLVGSALCPPYFVIDASIFAGVGELFAFASLGAFIKALDLNKGAKITKGDTVIEVGDNTLID